MNRSPTVSDGGITLRLIRQRDAGEWREVRRRNRDWLKPWEASLPPEASLITEVPATFGEMVRRMRRDARAGRSLPWAIIVDGRFAGQLTVGGITYGSLRSAYIGYWIDKSRAGRSFMSEALVVLAQYAFENLHLHRLEVCIIPRNHNSRRVMEKLDIRTEGVAERFLEINGVWEDHVRYGITIEEWNDRREEFLANWINS